MIKHFDIKIKSYPRGFHLITNEILQQLPEFPENALLNLFIKHTSAALTINENADPSVRTDMENIFNRLIKENESYYTHTFEG
ncbi:MAG: YjbQ family protein, partial [Bacteroidota bacterium]|nr:YjbQ family protein [Bacteroidota bacterium]